MRISVAMATYNGERFISEQLHSLAAQTLRPDELVVSDDGSTDTTLRIVESFARSAPFPVLILRNRVNVGFTLNFFRAAAQCSGDLLVFCDQDNVWLRHKLERCAGIFSDQEIVLMVHSSEVIDESGARVGQRLRAFRRSGKVTGRGGSQLLMIPQGCVMTLRREVFLELWSSWPEHLELCVPNGHGNLFGHDTLTYCAARDLGHIYYEKEPLVLFRVHDRNAAAPRLAFGSPYARIRYVLAQSSRARASVYRRTSEGYAAGGLLILALCGRRRFRSLQELEEMWSRAAGNLRLRAELYDRRWVDYWARYVRMLVRGSYARRTRGGLGFRSALKDLAVGCLMPAALWMTPTDPGARGEGSVGV